MEEQGLELYQGRQGRGEKPAEVVEKAKEQARVLSDIINQVGLYSVIQGNKYIRYEAWQTLANFVGITPFVEWTKEIQRDDTTIGYECRALALRAGKPYPLPRHNAHRTSTTGLAVSCGRYARWPRPVPVPRC